MIKKIFLLSFVLVSGLSFGQLQKLTLKESVNEVRKFYPEQVIGFQWIPGTNDYSYLKNATALYISSATSNNVEGKEILTIKELNAATGATLNWFSGLEWIDSKTFRVTDGSKYTLYNIETKKGSVYADLGDDAENAEISVKGVIAFTKENNLYICNRSIMSVTNNSDKNIVSGATYARSEFGIKDGIFWSPKGNLLAFAQKDESEVHNYPLLDNSVTPGALKSIKYPMTGQKSEKPKIGIYHVESKKTVFIAPRGAADSYLTNVSWTPDEQFILIAEVNRDQNHMWLNKYSANTGEFIKTLFEEKNDKWIEPEHPAFFPSENSNNFVWISERSGYNNLYYYDIEGKLIKQLTNNKFVVKDILTATKEGKEIIFSSTGESPLNTVYFSVDLKGTQKLITKESGTHRLEVSPNGAYFYNQYSSSTVGNIVRILSADGKVQKEILNAKDKLANYAIGTTEIKTIRTADNAVLYTRLIKPRDFDSTKKYPVLVYVYGGPHLQLITNTWLNGASLWMHWMADQGYLVYSVDNRGSAERGFEFESAIHRRLGTIETQDQVAGLEDLKKNSFVDANRIAVHGWSFGGFMTTSLMLKYPEQYNVGVAGGLVTDWKFYEAMYGERYMDTPEQNPDGYKESSLMTHASKLKGDLLLIHGTVDDVVVMQQNFALVQKFVDLGIQVDFFPYPMHPHNVQGKDRLHLMEKVLNYVLKNNN